VKFRPRTAAQAAALSLSGSVLGGLLVGSLIGDHWDWNPAAALIGLFLGIIFGFYNLAKAIWNKK
jgi:F0F1-type ATP synthase assembly protein I